MYYLRGIQLHDDLIRNKLDKLARLEKCNIKMEENFPTAEKSIFLLPLITRFLCKF